MCCMFTDIPLEQEKHSSGLPNILTAAHSWEREGRRCREKTSYSLMLHLTFSLSTHWTLHFLLLEFLRRSYCGILLTRLSVCTDLQSQLSYLRWCCEGIFRVTIPKAWYLADMARGIESLVSLNPFFSMDSAQGRNSDNCKFWLLDLGMCFDYV